MSNNLDPDQDRHSIGLDLGPNCLQRLLADDKSHHWQAKSDTKGTIQGKLNVKSDMKLCVCFFAKAWHYQVPSQ